MKIIKVKQGGIGDKLGLKPGDRLLKINAKNEEIFAFSLFEKRLSADGLFNLRVKDLHVKDVSF